MELFITSLRNYIEAMIEDKSSERLVYAKERLSLENQIADALRNLLKERP